MANGTATAEGAAPASPQRTRYPGRAAAVFLLTVLLGPPLGGVILLSPVLFAISTSPLGLSGIASLLWEPMRLGYLMGTVPACVSGLWVAWKVWRNGTIGYREVAVAALAASTLPPIFFAMATVSSGVKLDPASISGIAFTFLYFAVAALVTAPACRWIAGRAGILPR